MGRKKKEREILSLEILYDHKEELNELVESEDFHQLLLDESIKVIEESLKIKDNEVKLFSMTNLDCFLLLKKSNFRTTSLNLCFLNSIPSFPNKRKVKHTIVRFS